MHLPCRMACLAVTRFVGWIDEEIRAARATVDPVLLWVVYAANFEAEHCDLRLGHDLPLLAVVNAEEFRAAAYRRAKSAGAHAATIGFVRTRLAPALDLRP